MFKRIFYNHMSNRIHLWESTEDHKTKKLVIKPDIEYYVPDQSGESDKKDIWGNSVRLVRSNSRREMKEFVDYSNVPTCETSLSEDVKFLQKRYGGKKLVSDINEFQVATIDIEVEAGDEFPDPTIAERPINLISVHYSKQDEIFTFGNREYTGTDESVKNYHYCHDEETLLRKFIFNFRRMNVDILTGWNSKLFDVPYIVNRCSILDIEESMSPINIINPKRFRDDFGNTVEGFDIAGISVLDGLELYKKFTFVKQVSYSLNNIGVVEVNEGKLDLEGQVNSIYKTDWNKFVEYNVQDVLLTKKINDKKKFIDLTINLSYQALIPFDRVFSTVALVTGYMVNYLHRKNIVFPDPPKHRIKEEYPGAYVMAKKGLYEYIMSFDVESMYPHMIMMYNISPETLVLDPIDTEGLIKTPASNTYICDTPSGKFSVNGIYYRKDKKGVLPEIVENIFNDRKYFKNKMKVAEGIESKLSNEEISKNTYLPFDLVTKLSEEVNEEGLNSGYYDSQQHIRKILINCFHENTDIITLDGIKKIKDVKVGDLVYSINPENNDLEVKKVTHTYEYDYDGDLHRIKNTKVNIAVTPEHKMLEESKGFINKVEAKTFVKKCNNKTPIHNMIYKRKNERNQDTINGILDGRITFIENIKNKSKFNEVMCLILELGFIPRYTIDSGCYRISWNKTNLWIKKYSNSIEKYKGKVYNLTVEDNHTVCVGEGGKFLWTGQSIYGCLGTKHFSFYNIKNAMAITIGGRHLIQFLSDNVNKYIKDYWHKLIKKYYPEIKNDVTPLKSNICILIDTDSSYLCFDELITNSGFKFKDNEEFRQWANDFDKRILSPFFEKILKKYADNYEVDQLINFKREKIITKKIILAKKKYADLVIDDEGKVYDIPKLSVTGIEIVRSSTPKFCRDRLKEATEFILNHKDKEKTIDKIREINKEFMKCEVDDISYPRSVNNYTKYAKNVKEYIKLDEVIYPKGCPQHVKAAMNYNFLIKKYNLNLQPISNGTKIKYIKVNKRNELKTEVIGYVGKYPEEFRSIFKIDYEEQWKKSFQDIIQRFFDVTDWGIVTLNSNCITDFIEF